MHERLAALARQLDPLEIVLHRVAARQSVHPQLVIGEQAQGAAGHGHHHVSHRHVGTVAGEVALDPVRSEEHTSELQSLMRISYAVFCLKKKTKAQTYKTHYRTIIIHPYIKIFTLTIIH